MSRSTTSRRRSAVALVVWTVTLAAVTVAMLAVRDRLDKAHITLILLLLVLVGSAQAGRVTGLWLAGVSFLIFNWFFLPPYGTFVIADPLDWLVLVAFLVTSIVAAQLLYRAQEEARAAGDRAAEIDRLATLGAETLNVARADEAITAVAEVIRATTGVATSEIFVRDGGVTMPPPARDSLAEWVAEHGTAAIERQDGTVRLATPHPAAEEIARLGADVRALLLPLRARERTVGVLRLASPNGLRLDPEQWRFLSALSYYAALGVERARHAAAAEHAEALREADRLKDALLASVSHDLRTPLTTIKALAHDLRPLGDARTEIIEQETDRLNRTVADLLDLSRLNAGALPMRVEINAVDDLLGALGQRMESTPAGPRLRMALMPDEPLLVGRFDLVHALRILANLVENAAKYAPDDSPIDVTVSREGNEIVIRVSDRGPGVPPAEAERIFEAFYRPPYVTADVAGTGLGLSIARRLAERQGGSVRYAPRPGGGSVFSLHLPAEDVELAARSL